MTYGLRSTGLPIKLGEKWRDGSIDALSRALVQILRDVMLGAGASLFVR